MDDRGEIIIYQTEDGLTKIDVSMQDETVWLTQVQMAELFQRDKSTISRHIKNIFAEGELDEKWLLQNLQQPVMLKPFVYCHVNSVFMGFVGILEENKLTRYIKIQCVFANQLNICTRVKYLLTR